MPGGAVPPGAGVLVGEPGAPAGVDAPVGPGRIFVRAAVGPGGMVAGAGVGVDVAGAAVAGGAVGDGRGVRVGVGIGAVNVKRAVACRYSSGRVPGHSAVTVTPTVSPALPRTVKVPVSLPSLPILAEPPTPLPLTVAVPAGAPSEHSQSTPLRSPDALGGSPEFGLRVSVSAAVTAADPHGRLTSPNAAAMRRIRNGRIVCRYPRIECTSLRATGPAPSPPRSWRQPSDPRCRWMQRLR